MIKEYGYEYDAVLNRELLEITKDKVTNQKFMGAYGLRSGRDALKAIAREFSSRVAILPALACDSMIHPFELYGHQIQYYKLNKDYSIDLESINTQNNEQYLFLYTDYFGRRAISDNALETLRKRGNIMFIEDRTHSLIWERQYSFRPDYIIASLRKWIPIPDGGLLWGEISKPLGSDTSFSAARLKAQCMRNKYLSKGDESLKTEYRRIFSTVAEMMNEDEPSRMSAYAYALAADTDWDMLKKKRRENSETLISMLASSPHISFIQDRSGMSDLYVAFTVPNRNEVQKRLSTGGIFNTIIWPLTKEQKRVCSVARFTEENMLAAPCDQRYSIDDMKTIGNEIVRMIANVNG